MALSPQAKSFVENKFPAYAGKIDSLSSIPGFDFEFERGYEIFREGMSTKVGGMVGGGLGIMNKSLSTASSDPVAFVKAAMRDAVFNNDMGLLKSEAQYLVNNNVSIDEVKSLAEGYGKEYAQKQVDLQNWMASQRSSSGGGIFGDLFGGLSNELAKLDPSAAISRELTNVFQPVEKSITAAVSDVSKALSTDDAKKAMGVAAAYFLPGVGAQLGQQLVTQGLITGAAVPYATAIGTALAQAGVGVAQGQSFDTALTNATVNAVTSTGSQNVAQYISTLGASPEVANAVTSVGASGLATAAKGGSAADIEKNMVGALAGSTVTGLTGDKLSGSIVGGAVTGGATGAATAAAAELGSPARQEAAQVEAEQDKPVVPAPATPTVVSTAEQDIRNLMANVSPGIQTADVSGRVIALPEGVRDDVSQQLGINLPNVGGILSPVSDETQGALPTVTVTDRAEPITFQEGQPDLPELSKVGEGLVITSDLPSNAGPGAGPAISAPASAGVTTPVTTPTISPADQAVIDLTGIGGGNVGGNVIVGPGADAGTGVGNATGNVVISDAGAGAGNAAGNVVVGPGDGGAGNVAANVAVTQEEPTIKEEEKPSVVKPPPVVEPPPAEELLAEEEPTPEEPYKPELFIYGGRAPKTSGRQTTNLGTTLQAPFYPTSTLGQALTGYRGAGEIEGKKSGKPRKNVWNEESLRLKDALGL